MEIFLALCLIAMIVVFGMDVRQKRKQTKDRKRR